MEYEAIDLHEVEATDVQHAEAIHVWRLSTSLRCSMIVVKCPGCSDTQHV